MEIEFHGANCVTIKTKNSSVVIDDNLKSLGKKTVTKATDVALFTNKNLVDESTVSVARLTIDSAGEFEIGDLSIKSLQTRSHMDEASDETANVFQFLYQGTTVTVLGHVHPDVTNDVLEMIGGTDVLVVPVGGNGYTLDVVGANSVIKKAEPDVVIPTHFEDKNLDFPVPASPLSDFVTASGLKSTEPMDVYKVNKPDAELAGSTHLVILNAR